MVTTPSPGGSNMDTSKRKRGVTIMKKIINARNKGQKIESCFNIDDSHKKWVCMEAGKLHRNFRTEMTKFYFNHADGIGKHPPKKYAEWITDEEWSDFIVQRLSEAFKLKEADSDITSVPRHILWKAARVNKSGETLSQSVSQEERHSHGKDDILAKAFSRPEYPGRVRAQGFGVCHRDYFKGEKISKQDRDIGY
ncbi:hypothetical protein RJT34_16619 [Clitoria ternatea]|uniref:Uncharacterized protein n=1 Tax=Clitoria ternatea TaxID=43366 RepID=A0AAN9J919_CLITE